ncbi:MAG: M20/M25/M40 family metallo-hydrolase [Gemmatimonadota bacterium]
MSLGRIVYFVFPEAAAIAAAACLVLPPLASAQETVPPLSDERLSAIIDSVSAARIEHDIRTLAAFGTRHTLSDTTSETRGIGAARRWIKAELDRVSAACGGCLEVEYHRSLVDSGARIPRPTWVVNVVATLRGSRDPERVLVISGHYDSRATDALDATSDAPGANDDASGTAAVLEAARVLTSAGRPYGASIVFAALAGEEQGLYGGQHLAEVAHQEGWRIEGVFNNDIIGNIQGQDGVVDGTTVRVFSESPPATTTPDNLRQLRFYGGEVDGPSRQLARYVDRIAERYFSNLDVMMIYRLDRFGRGGDHRPFNDLGFPAVRLTEAHEDWRRQHQDLRVEDGVEYGDVPDEVEFDYAAAVTALNVATLASLAWAPAPPDSVMIAGAVEPSARLSWAPVSDPALAGYKVYWRRTDSPTWNHWRWVGKATEAVVENLVVDNWFFGVASVDKDGHESVVVFPAPAPR